MQPIGQSYRLHHQQVQAFVGLVLFWLLLQILAFMPQASLKMPCLDLRSPIEMVAWHLSHDNASKDFASLWGAWGSDLTLPSGAQNTSANASCWQQHWHA